MRILITGGAGFIGSHMAEHHLNKGHTVHVIDDLSTGTQQNIDLFKKNPNYHFTAGNILTFSELTELVCWADRIYHLAAYVGVLRVIHDSENLLAINIAGTERVLRAAKLSKRNPRIMLASSSEVYGDGHAKPLSEKSNLIIGEGRKSCSAYVVSKISLEYFGLSYYEHYEMAVTPVRIFNTIGPRQLSQYGMVVPRFIKNAIQNDPISVYGTGEQTRSFCDVRDTVAILDCLAENPKAHGEIVNVGQEQEVSINHLAKEIKRIAKSASPIQHVSYDDAYGEGFEDFMFRCPDVTKLMQLTNNYKYQWNLQKSLTDLIAKTRNKT